MDASEIPVVQLDTTPALDTRDGLLFHMYYAQCLAAGSYLLAHDGWAVLVDPLRDVEQYIQALDAAGVRLKAVLLTHGHADYVGGHAELAARTGAVIVAGRGAGMTFAHLRARSGDVLALSDKYQITAVETPGHTLGCVTYVVAAQRPLLAFTGDTLFVGSCGRPDLVGATVPAATMAEKMYASLQRLSELPGELLVFPAHGAGSPCGKALSDKLYSTLEHEKRTNPALMHKDVTSFVQWLVGAGSMASPPQYFAECVRLNLQGAAAPLGGTVSKVPVMRSAAFADAAAGHLVVDTREADDFLAAHIPGSVHLCLGTHGGELLSAVDGNFSIWLGTMITAETFYVVTTPGKEQEVLERMGRVGYEQRVAGLTTDVSACKPVTVERFPVESPAQVRASGVQFVDVRTPQEFACPRKGRLEGAVNLPLRGTMAEFLASADSLERAGRFVCVCSGGFRSALAASLLRHAGLTATDVFGGYELSVAPKLSEMLVNKRKADSAGPPAKVAK